MGDRLICDIYVDSFRRSHGQDVIVIKNVIADLHGTGMQTTWTTMLARTPDTAPRTRPPRPQPPAAPNGHSPSGCAVVPAGRFRC
ncbi:dehydrogenase [Rhodococcus wratislaviensis IFP 2016]|nr:dehydrogenase [Rhodococcus wratislaviensis IFP 2016]